MHALKVFRSPVWLLLHKLSSPQYRYIRKMRRGDRLPLTQVMHPHTKYHWPISKDKNVMVRTRKYYLKNNHLTLRSNVKVSRRSWRYATHHLMFVHPHANHHWPISKDKNVMARTRKYYLKNNYLTLWSKVKVPRRSLRYATHRLMVIHPHTKYHWPISKDKKGYGPDKLRWEEVEEKIRLKQYVSLRSKGINKYMMIEQEQLIIKQ